MSLTSLATGLAVPLATIATGAVAYIAKEGGTYFATRKHNALLSRVADGIGRVAGDINLSVSKLDAGADFHAVEQALIATGVTSIKNRFADTVAALEMPDSLIATMISGELGKLVSAPVARALKSAATIADVKGLVSDGLADVSAAMKAHAAALNDVKVATDALAGVTPAPGASVKDVTDLLSTLTSQGLSTLKGELTAHVDQKIDALKTDLTTQANGSTATEASAAVPAAS